MSIDEILDEIYQDRNTLGDKPIDRNTAKSLIQSYVNSERGAKAMNIGSLINELIQMNINRYHPPVANPTNGDMQRYENRIAQIVEELNVGVSLAELSKPQEGEKEV